MAIRVKESSSSCLPLLGFFFGGMVLNYARNRFKVDLLDWMSFRLFQSIASDALG